jgi:hypothetical protein
MNGDRINPIVIKELRQGLKSRSFLISFVGLQVAMIISMFIYITSAVSPLGDLSGADVFFWVMLNILFLLLMPLRSFQALYEEINGKTLELLFLTRMTSWNISFGKWVALVTQALLMVAAILPYFVLRYFLGSIDIPLNLFALAITLLTTMVLMAVGVGLSCVTSKLLRVLMMIGGAGMLWTTGMSIFAMFSFGGMMGMSSPDYPGIWAWLGILAGATLAIVYFVEYGASRIAPPAENHARRKRGIGFLVFVLFLIMALVEEDGEVMMAALFFLVPMMVGAMCEPLHKIPGAYRSRMEIPGIKWLLLPGWPSGLLFTAALMFLLSTSAFFMEGDEDILFFFTLLFNVLVLPYVVIRLIPWLQHKPLVAYFAFQVISFLVSMMFMVLNEIGINPDGLTKFLGVPIPTLGLMLFDDMDWGYFAGHVFMTCVLGVIILLVTLPGLAETARLRNYNPDDVPYTY